MSTANPDLPRAATGRPRRLLTVLTLLTTGTGAVVFSRVVAAERIDAMAVALLVLFVVLLFWIALSFWVATAGFIRLLFAKPQAQTANSANAKSPSLPLEGRSAILMPV